MKTSETVKSAVVAVGVGFVAMGAMMLAFFLIDLYGVTHPVQKELPACIEEDGSTQQECIWDDGSGLIVHNWDWGKQYETWART